MAYYLTIQKNKSEFKQINISLLEEFKRISKFKNGYSLEEIDHFTSMFDDEVKLKELLYDKGLITSEDITKEISIKQKINNELVKVRYGLIYKINKKYLDAQYLRSRLLSLQSDKNFLKKLVSYYRNSYSCVIEVSEIKNYLFDKSSEVDINLTLNSFFLKEIFQQDKNTLEYKLKYKSFHDLSMFVQKYINENIEFCMSDYDVKKRLLELQELKIVQETKDKPKTKKLTKGRLSKLPIEGQISFFD